MKDFKRYGVEVGQKYVRTNQQDDFVVVVDVESYADQNGVVVAHKNGDVQGMACPTLIIWYKLA